MAERAIRHAQDRRPAGPGWDWIERPGFKVFWDAPAVVIISGPTGDCCRAGQNFMLSSHARGLGSCWVGSPMLWLTTPEVRAELKIPSDLLPVAVLCLGYPAGVPEAIVRERPPVVWA
jgi:nitroreductase